MAMRLRELEQAVRDGFDLSRGDFRDGCSYRGADLRGGKFAGCDFTGVDLSEVSFIEADLTDAILAGAKLNETNMARAKLAGAVLIDCSARYLYLEAAEMDGAIGLVDAGIDPRGYHFFGIWHSGKASDRYYRDYRGWIISAGCRWFNERHAIEHWTYQAMGCQHMRNQDALNRVAKIMATPEPAGAPTSR